METLTQQWTLSQEIAAVHFLFPTGSDTFQNRESGNVTTMFPNPNAVVNTVATMTKVALL